MMLFSVIWKMSYRLPWYNEYKKATIVVYYLNFFQGFELA